MTYRWAVTQTLGILAMAMLSSIALPAAAWAQFERAPPAAQTNEDDGATCEPNSPAARFAAAAAQSRITLPGSPRRAAKRSVLDPSTSRWLEDETNRPGGKGPSPGDLAPDDLLSGSPCHSDLPPEAMPDNLPGLRGGPNTMLEAGDLSPPPSFFDSMPRIPPRRQPMLRESWLFRPFNVSVFEGALFATPPIKPQFHAATGYFTGFRVGWDFATHFGVETRFGFSKVYVLNADVSTLGGYQKIFYFDSNLLIYPWGDTRWRPFLSLGGGLADVSVVANNGLNLHPGAFNLPFGGGIKYRYGSRVAFRADIRDNLTFLGGGGLQTLNNLEVLGGIEFHFGGGDRRGYWPWNPSKHWW